MLIELLSSSNYVNFNIKLAQLLGLKPSIYLSLIMDINEKAIRKDKVDKNFFTVDRKYIEARTTITKDEQVSIEKDLINIGIIERHPEKKNTISLNITTLTSIMMTPDEDLLKDISSLSKAKKKSKSQAIAENLKSNVITLNAELQEAYNIWIDSVLEKKGVMTKAAVIIGQRTLDEFTNRDLDIALKVLEIASIHGYDDITWAINTYKKDFNSNSYSSTNRTAQVRTQACNSANVVQAPRTRISDEVF